MEAPQPIQEMQREIAAMIPKVVRNCAGFQVRYAKRRAGDMPACWYWDKVDPRGLMSRDRHQWEISQRIMVVPVITIDFSRVPRHENLINGAKWADIEDQLLDIIYKYRDMYLNGLEGRGPWRGVDPRLILFRCRPFDYAITPTCALARIPPECSKEFQRLMGIDSAQVLTHKVFLNLDNPNDAWRLPWENEWVEWNEGIADREAREARYRGGSESRHGCVPS
ncbi:hypothetical protein F5B19DRAFT_195786 [Rostrohypoxylon terebratum]|nr:hypothetical protein F5B19DRAFT_195786 [Rostrohypoxylon terebratum]